MKKLSLWFPVFALAGALLSSFLHADYIKAVAAYNQGKGKGTRACPISIAT
jgi:hypothetical protein